MRNTTDYSGLVKFILIITSLSLILLKLTGHIDWSWWYVTLPISGGVIIIGFLVGFLIGKTYIGMAIDFFFGK
jgi:hypothetical protein